VVVVWGGQLHRSHSSGELAGSGPPGAWAITIMYNTSLPLILVIAAINIHHHRHTTTSIFAIAIIVIDIININDYL